MHGYILCLRAYKYAENPYMLFGTSMVSFHLTTTLAGLISFDISGHNMAQLVIFTC